MIREIEGNFLMLIMTIIVMTMMMIYRDQQLTRYKRGFTTSAGGHLLPLHNHNLWRELVGWRLSTGEGWRETKNILGRRGGGGKNTKYKFHFTMKLIT